MPDLKDAGGFIQWRAEPDDDEAVLFGTLLLLRTSHHVAAIQVREDEDGNQVAVKDPYGRLDDAYHVDNVRFQTVTLPGREGDWVLVVTPHGE